MTRYALNVKKGTTIQHPDVRLPGLIAVRVDDHVANQLKNIINVVIFDKVEGIDEERVTKLTKPLYNLNKNTLEVEKEVKK